MEAQLAMIKLEADEEMTFVKGGIPGFPPMAYTQNLKDMLADIYGGKLSVAEARKAIETLHDKEPPYPPILNWLGVVIVSIGFAVDVVGTWEGMLWAGITGLATGLAFVAADHVAGFGKIAQLVATFASGVIVMVAYKYGWTAAAPGLLLISSTFVFIPGDSISTQAYELSDGQLVRRCRSAVLQHDHARASGDRRVPRHRPHRHGGGGALPHRAARRLRLVGRLPRTLRVRDWDPARLQHESEAVRPGSRDALDRDGGRTSVHDGLRRGGRHLHRDDGRYDSGTLAGTETAVDPVFRTAGSHRLCAVSRFAWLAPTRDLGVGGEDHRRARLDDSW